MPVNEETISKIRALLATHATVNGLKETDELKDVPLNDVYEALHILQARGEVIAQELFGRG